jgi:hypothetical protein
MSSGAAGAGGRGWRNIGGGPGALVGAQGAKDSVR